MLPGVLLIAGVAVLLLGWLPRWSVLAWALFGFALLQAYLGDLLRFPDALSGVSPFWHLPRVPAEQFTAAPGAGRPRAGSGAVRRRRPRPTTTRHRLTAQPVRWSGTA